MTEVGTNLTAPVYWSGQLPFIDRMRLSGEWVVQGNNPDPVQLDARGYPIGLPRGATNLVIMAPVDPADAGTEKTYVLTWEGTATVNVTYANVISSVPGKIVFTSTNQGQFEPIFVRGLDPANPLSDMHLVRADQEAAFKAGEIFNQAFLDKVDGFEALRFMDWGSANFTVEREWADRTTMDVMNAAYYLDRSVPIEIMVELSNRTGSDMWYNVPIRASDDYVRNAVQYIKDNLHPDLKLHLEYSNEVWNYVFPQATYSLEQSAPLFGHDANGDGRIDPNDRAEVDWAGNSQYYGYRSAQIAALARSVYGDAADSRLANVLSSQTAHYGLEAKVFEGVQRAGLGGVGELFDEWAITTYFGGNMTGETAADRQTLLGWARGGTAGLDAAFEALMVGTGLETVGSVDYLKNILSYQGTVARRYGLDLVAYEGGFGFWAIGFDVADRDDMMDLIKRMKADPRMGDAYRKMVGDFAAAGGDLMNAFTDVAPDSVLSTFGTLPNIYAETPAYDALVSLNTSTADVTTAVGSYVLGSKVNNLTYTGTADFTGTGNARDNVMYGNVGADLLYGRAGNDVLYGGAGNDLLDGGAGNDRMIGGTGNDIYVVAERADEVVELPDEGTDEVRTSLASYQLLPNFENLSFIGAGGFEGRGNTARNVITGSGGNDRLLGYAGDDWLIGGAGDDILNGGEGNDRMEGGAGDDNYTVKQDGDEVIERPSEGHDTVRVHLARWTLPTNVEDVIFRGLGTFEGTGNALNNMMRGGAGNDRLYGLAGNDLLIGLEGDDLLDGGTGADRMEGGLGDDTYVVDSTGDVVVEFGEQGVDQVNTSLSGYTLGSDVENLLYTGTGFFTGVGNSLANRLRSSDGGSRLEGLGGNDDLVGGAGADFLDGGEGADRMVGGAGNDVYVVDSPLDVLVEAPGGGRDQVRTFLSRYDLLADFEDLAFIGTGAFTGIGTDVANTLEGGSGDDLLYGLGGNDSLIGGDGNDLLDGGTGADRMLGGRGDDVYIVDNAADSVGELAGQGRDEVRASVTTFTLPSEIEDLIFTGLGAFYGAGNASDNLLRGSVAGDNRLYGEAGNDRLYGGAGNDLLDGGSGADWMDGGLGNDEYLVDDPGDVIVDAGGTDVVRSTVNWSLGAGLENLFLLTGAVNGTGNDSDNQIFGNDVANLIRGLGGADLLYGRGGNDRIEGGDGADRLFGEDGDDDLFGGADNDTLNGGAGADRLYGEGGADELSGGAGNDWLDGGDGADRLYGDGGDDLLLGGAGDDVMNGGDGADRLEGGAGNDSVAGDAGDDLLFGDAGNDILWGGTGNDVLVGGAGKDTLWGEAGADTFRFAPGDLARVSADTDTVWDFSRAQGDKLDFSAFDGDSTTSLRDPLRFVGTATFSGSAGELRCEVQSGAWIVQGDLDGDRVADFMLNVRLDQTLPPLASDFLL